MDDQHARRLDQLERENAELRRTIERLTARIERLEASAAWPRPMAFGSFAITPNIHNSADPLGR